MLRGSYVRKERAETGRARPRFSTRPGSWSRMTSDERCFLGMIRRKREPCPMRNAAPTREPNARGREKQPLAPTRAEGREGRWCGGSRHGVTRCAKYPRAERRPLLPYRATREEPLLPRTGSNQSAVARGGAGAIFRRNRQRGGSFLPEAV